MARAYSQDLRDCVIDAGFPANPALEARDRIAIICSA
jgi:hypothetical protein